MFRKNNLFILFLLFSFIIIFSYTSFAIVYPWEYNEQFIFPEITPQSQAYQVQYGDSLYSIAQRFGISIEELRRENNLWHDNIIPGQQLVIPGQQNNIIYRVKWGDSLYRIAQNFNTTITRIRDVNQLSSNNLIPGQELIIPGTAAEEINRPNDYTIVVDAGHGGSDPGAVTYLNSQLIKESDLVLDISNRLVSLLNEAGYNAVSTRSGDYNVALWRRVQLAYQHHADLFVSIHVDNNPPNPVIRGSNVYISPGANWNTYQLADQIQSSLEQTTNRPSNYLGRIIRQPFTVNMQSRPAVLVETGFLSNWSDLTSLQNPQFRYLIAQGIFNGIENWLN